jgi:hypothetical protein
LPLCKLFPEQLHSERALECQHFPWSRLTPRPHGGKDPNGHRGHHRWLGPDPRWIFVRLGRPPCVRAQVLESRDLLALWALESLPILPAWPRMIVAGSSCGCLRSRSARRARDETLASCSGARKC